MKQSRFMSMLETVLSTATGFGISLFAQWFFLPLLGVEISLHQNFAFAVIMTFVSLARQFIMRRIFEALHMRTPMSPAMLAIAAERRRQIEVEGWSPEHDALHPSGDLALAGAAYAMLPGRRRIVAGKPTFEPSTFWPWTPEWWKPTDNRRDLVKAGALILAELEKHDRARRSRRGAA